MYEACPPKNKNKCIIIISNNILSRKPEKGRTKKTFDQGFGKVPFHYIQFMADKECPGYMNRILLSPE